MKTLPTWALAAALALPTIGFAEAQPAGADDKTFEEYCKDENLPAEQRKFVEAILNVFKTDDCSVPEKRLKKDRSTIGIDEPVLTDITPIKGLKDLRGIMMQGHRISDLTPLSELTNLQFLHLSSNFITDISPLAKLSNLKFLHLADNQISDLSVLKGMPVLDDLDIRHNPITDFSALAHTKHLIYLAVGKTFPHWQGQPCQGPRIKTTGLKENLKHLTKLTYLNAVHLDLADTSFIEGMPGLETVLLDCNLITKTQIFDRLPNATKITLSYNPLEAIESTVPNDKLWVLGLAGIGNTHVEFLENYPGLEYLNIAHNEVIDASPLAGLKKLVHLNARNNRISDASFLVGLRRVLNVDLDNNGIAQVPFAKMGPKVSSLSLANNALTKIEGVEALKNLRSLDISSNTISDISPLGKFDKDREDSLTLDISATDVTDLSPLKGANVHSLFLDSGNFSELAQIPNLPMLKGLSMNHSLLTSIEGLATRFPSLERLEISHNPIADITELENLVNIYSLEIASTQVTDISAISHLTEMIWLNISGNGITSLKPLENMSDLKDLRAQRNEISDLTPLSTMSLIRADLAHNKITSLAPLAKHSDLRQPAALSMKGNPLGTTTGKTAENCPTDSMSFAVNAWCKKK